MKLEQEWDVNYNGGVIRFTPAGKVERIVIWQTSNLTVQQHSASATFSAPTIDGRQAWLNISRDGQINGGGIHGKTLDSYVRCGDSRNGVDSVGPTSISLRCRYGLRLNEDGIPDPTVPVVYNYDTWEIVYDFSEYPFKLIINLNHPEFSFLGPGVNLPVHRNVSFDGSLADAYIPAPV